MDDLTIIPTLCAEATGFPGCIKTFHLNSALTGNLVLRVTVLANQVGVIDINAELVAIVEESSKLLLKPKPHKTVSDKLIGLYKEIILHFLITEEGFKNKNLSLLSMSLQLKIPQKYISHIVNKEFGIGFNDFVNYLRLKFFNEIEFYPANRIYSRETVANMAGFPSSPTFYRAQKKLSSLSLGI